MSLLALCAAPLVAQQHAINVRVHGVAFDSLAMRPLASALVVGEGSETTVRTDSLGRFDFAVPQATRRLLVYHESLDQYGLTALTAERDPLAAADSVRSHEWRITVATPSIETLWRTLCGGKPPRKGPGGIVVGTTRLSTGALVGGVGITLQWQEDRTEAGGVQTRTARSDSLAQFTFCGVSEYGDLGVEAQSTEYASAAVLVPMGDAPLRRVNLILGGRNELVPLSGIALDVTGVPVAGAMVQVDGVKDTVRTDDDGRFRLPAVPTGSRMISSRKVGFVPAVEQIDVNAAPVTPVRLVMERGVTLAGVRVTAKRSINRYATDFNRRLSLRMGTFLTGRQLASHSDVRMALYGMPGLVITPSRYSAGFMVLGKGTRLNARSSGGIEMGRCAAATFLDGVLEDIDRIGMVPIESIAAIEVHASYYTAPIQFRDLQSNCSIVLVWTKAFLAR